MKKGVYFEKYGFILGNEKPLENGVFSMLSAIFKGF
jgi:hypothetical protein